METPINSNTDTTPKSTVRAGRPRLYKTPEDLKAHRAAYMKAYYAKNSDRMKATSKTRYNASKENKLE